MDSIPLTLDDLAQARARIPAEALGTPLWRNDVLSRDFGLPIHFKLENLQPTGSFKLRGASHKIDRLLAAGRGQRGVIAASAGNHAQGVARAALVSGLPATVVMPVGAPLTKIEACRGLAAEVVLAGNNLEEAKLVAERLGDERGLDFVHPYDDWEVIAGQASIGLEIMETLPAANLIVVPLGGGGLISGVALAIKLQHPAVRIVGVQTETVAPFRRFLDDGSLEAVTPSAHTIADGIKVKAPGVLTRQVIARHVDAIVTVDDNAIAEAMVCLLERTRTIGEGAGVVALAALRKGRVLPRPDDCVVLLISGGNADMTLVGRSIDYGLASSGRLMSLAVTIPDSPGRLAGLLGVVAEHGMNVRHVEHRRGELHVAVGMTEIILQIETRDLAHQQELLEHFAAQGLAARNLLATR
ncbi:MAG: threonine ammonia-lyase [Candidatus Accumulibacter sp.]|uniref:threonine ammonia-lyase n=1 Tax=Accumulibacter sp. TaxID=2053492 RepID=UPI001A4FB138|nr:threonine ammonia-lyase [Accumulibacter sp.]MBL8393153.1 threonine ammonia-lyase [Accumulibacter sp.]